MKKVNGLALICREATLFFRPLLDAVDSDGNPDGEAILDFFEGLGYDLRNALEVGSDKQNIVDCLEAIFKAVAAMVKELVKIWPEAADTITGIDFPDDLEGANVEIKELESQIDKLSTWYTTTIAPEVAKLLLRQKDLVTYAKNLKAAFNNDAVGDAFSRLPVVTLNALTYNYLRRKHAALMPTLEFLTVATWAERKELEVTAGNNKTVWVTLGVVPDFHLKKFGDLFSKPGKVIKDEYWPDEDWPGGFPTDVAGVNQVALKFFGRINILLQALGAHTVLGMPGLEPDGSDNLDMPERVKGLLTWYFPFHRGQGEIGKAGASIGLLADNADDNGPGLFAYPFLEASFDYATRSWIYSLAGALSPAAFKIDKNGFSWLRGPGNVEAQFTMKPAPDQEALFVLGTDTRLEIGSPTLQAGFKLLDDNQPDLAASVVFADNKIVLATPSGDGFLSKILPNKGMEIPFGLGVGWSNSRGFYFTGSAGLEVTLTPKLTLFNALRFDWIKVSLRADESALSASARLKISLDIKPFSATLGGMGLQYSWAYPKGGEPGKTEFKFLKPNMVGFVLKTNTVTGGGYLSVENGRYAGILELTFKDKISFKVITIIDTQLPLPGGKKGFAMILLVFVEGFKEIPLSMGFSLAGIGGLFALNRGMDIDVLRKGVQDKSFDSILFPKDPVANAEAIISDIDKAFPVRLNNFVFGPCAIITWGTAKALLRIKLGLFFEIKGGKFTTIAVPGILTCILPKEEGEQQLIALRVNFLGLLSFELGEFSFEACIFDSKIGTFALSGDMLVRLVWKGSPNFLASAGGFHPRYTPPPGVRQLRRMQLVLLDTAEAKIRLESYFAITSNSVQIGARIDAALEKSGLKIVGYIGFDTLVYFKPFRFSVDIYANFSVSKGDKVLMAIKVDIHLDGPAPWYFVGKATIQLLGQEIAVNIEKRTGQAAEAEVSLPDIHVLEWLIAELKKPENWQAISALSSGNLFDITPPAGTPKTTVVVPPQSRVRIAQQLVPLNVHVEKVGLAKPKVAGMLKIAQVACNGKALNIEKERAVESFAPAHFKNLTDSQKISTPSFVDYAGGVWAEPVNDTTMGKAVKVVEKMEALVLDGDNRTIVARPGGALTHSDINALLRNSPTGASAFSSKQTTLRARAVGGSVMGAKKNASVF